MAGAPRLVSAEARRSSEGRFCASHENTSIGIYLLFRCRRHTCSTSRWVSADICGGGSSSGRPEGSRTGCRSMSESESTSVSSTSCTILCFCARGMASAGNLGPKAEVMLANKTCHTEKVNKPCRLGNSDNRFFREGTVCNYLPWFRLWKPRLL